MYSCLALVDPSYISTFISVILEYPHLKVGDCQTKYYHFMPSGLTMGSIDYEPPYSQEQFVYPLTCFLLPMQLAQCSDEKLRRQLNAEVEAAGLKAAAGGSMSLAAAAPVWLAALESCLAMQVPLGRLLDGMVTVLTGSAAGPMRVRTLGSRVHTVRHLKG